MRITPNPLVEPYRLLNHPILRSTLREGNNGAFFFDNPRGSNYPRLACIVSDGTYAKESKVTPWEHVSVDAVNRCPTWEEMCYIKHLFWEEHEVVMQLHPAKSDYVNHHKFTLHLWRPLNATIPLPEKVMV